MPGNAGLDGTRYRDHLGDDLHTGCRRTGSQLRAGDVQNAFLVRDAPGLGDRWPRGERVMGRGLARRLRKSAVHSHDVHPAGLEPTTYSSGGCRSIQLSYGCLGGEIRAIRNSNQAVRA
jgi:hypothetical protein